MSESDSSPRLKREFLDREYRESYADSFLDTWIASQVCVLRKQRRLSQQELADLCGTKQPGIARLENANRRKVNLDMLRRVAAALDTRLRVSFETYGSLCDDAAAFSRQILERPTFEEDPAFWSVRQDSIDQQSGDPVRTMKTQVKLWIANGAPAFLLREWLSGARIPAAGHEEEPFRWIFRGLPTGAERATTVRTMAQRTADLIEELPDLQVRTASEYLHNLLHLAAGLETSDVLAPPLLEMYKRFQGRPELGPELRNALTAALIRNQNDQALREDWFELLHKRSHATLTGNETTGWAGVRRMPTMAGGDSPERPDWAAVGEALWMMAAHLESSEDRNRSFERLLRGLLELYGDEPSIHREILRASFGNKWPDWAKALVPRLLVLDFREGDRVFFLMSVPPYLFRVSWNPATRRGSFETLESPKDPTAAIAGFERAMLDVPEGSDRFFYNWLRSKVQLLWRRQPESPLAPACERLHMELLQVTPGLPALAELTDAA